MVKNGPANAGDTDLIPDRKTKTPHGVRQLSRGPAVREGTAIGEGRAARKGQHSQHK